jgi:hypothetical protein
MQVAIEMRKLIWCEIGLVGGLVYVVHDLLQAAQEGFQFVGAGLVGFE